MVIIEILCLSLIVGCTHVPIPHVYVRLCCNEEVQGITKAKQVAVFPNDTDSLVLLIPYHVNLHLLNGFCLFCNI